ncbi:MAG: hypothetical protein ACOH16_14400 [Propionibacteriaceae bacterium]
MKRTIRGCCVRVAAALSIGVVPACSAAPERADLADAATRFVSASPGEACDLLAPDTRAALERRTGIDCAQALTDRRLPTSTTVQGVDVAGQSGQVRLEGQVLFLARFPDGWRVTAAGCRRGDPDPAVPYVCVVEP